MAFHPQLGWVRRDLPNPALGINADGFRHPDVSRAKPPGTWRAFALGDSQTYGAGVDAAETYPSQAEALLRARVADGTSVELINAGISGYTSLQALRLVGLALLEWQPDAIVVDCRTYDSPRENVLGEVGGGDLLDRLTFHSRIVWTLRFLVERSRPVHARVMDGDATVMGSEVLSTGFGNHEPLAHLAQEKGLQLVFLDYPFWEGDGVACLAPAHELPPGVPVASACGALASAGVPVEQLFLDNNHLSVEGNRWVAEALAETILAQGWLPLR